MSLAMAALMLAAAMPAPEGCGGRLCQSEALAPFAAKVERLRGGAAETVHILQLGDSHTAGDMVTGAWRRRLQARYGDGGRGVLPPGRPYAGFLSWDVTAEQSPGWAVNSMFGDTYSPAGPPLGWSGFTQTTHWAGETLTITADFPDRPFDRLVVCGVVRPGGGGVRLRIGDAQELWRLDGSGLRAECRTVDSGSEATTATLTVSEPGPVSITSMGVFRRAGGLVLSNLGVSGAQLAHFARTNDEVLAGELAAYRPDLIVLAFGTNEGFSPILTADEYEFALREQLARIGRLAGADVPILLLAAPDAASRDASLRGRGIACGEGWSVPDLLERTRERQAAVAAELGLAYWRWSAAMGGTCASSAWHRAGLMRGDHVHFTPAGAERVGAMIDADISRAIEALH